MGNKKFLYSGVLENAGLGELSFYLRKSKQYLSYAMYSLDNTDFSDAAAKSKKVNKKVEELKQIILELDTEIEGLGLELEKAARERVDSEEE